MKRSIPIFRLFISSTFSDFHLEREALQLRVFPRLRELCLSHGASFQAVDLRWGIGEEAALDQGTLRICLEEVRRCQEITPRPNFLLLLGDRYGWQPLPYSIEAKEFEQLLGGMASLSGEQGARVLQRWYRFDGNVVPASYLLLPRSGKHVDPAHWQGTERSLLALLRAGALQEGFPKRLSRKYFLSATASEIEAGIFSSLASLEVKSQVFCHNRSFAGVPRDLQEAEGTPFFDFDEKQLLDRQAGAALLELQKRLKKTLGKHFVQYCCPWSERGNLEGYLARLESQVHAGLSGIITRELEQLERISPEAAESLRHRYYRESRSALLVGRRQALHAVSRYLAGSGAAVPLIISGQGGVGKTSLMAKAVELCASRDGGALTIARFVGISPESSRVDTLLRGICHELVSSLGLPPASEDVNDWKLYLWQLLERATAERPIRLFVDALDQFPPAEPTASVDWLPLSLPPHVRLVVSVIPGTVHDLLCRRFPEDRSARLVLGGIDPGSSTKALELWLKSSGRTLQPHQWQAVLASLGAETLPLYLKIVFEMVRRWSSWTAPRLPRTLYGSIRTLLARLAQEKHHGAVLTVRSLSYLAAARHGLSEDEMINLLSLDPVVLADFSRRSAKSPGASGRLPFIVWSRFYEELAPFLTEKEADDSVLLCFYHRVIEVVVRRSFLKNPEQRHEIHLALADFYQAQPLFFQGVPNLRKLSELPFHLLQSGRFQQLLTLLSDQEYFRAKLASGRSYEFLDEVIDCHALCSDSLVLEELPKLLLRQVSRFADSIPGSFDLESVHAYFVHRKDTSFYEKFLQLSLGEPEVSAGSEIKGLFLKIGLTARYANLLRRRGELDQARGILIKLISELPDKTAMAAEVSRIEYDMGYICYLSGDFEQALTWFYDSACSADRAGNRTGAWISRIALSHANLVRTMGTPEARASLVDFSGKLDEAWVYFSAPGKDDTTVERWVMNIRAHRFECAFLAGDVERAAGFLLELESDPWIHRFAADEIVYQARARLNLLRGVPAAALGDFARYLPTPSALSRNPAGRSREALARDYLDFGQAFWDSGNKRRALSTWKFALTLPDEAGNTTWKRLIADKVSAASK